MNRAHYEAKNKLKLLKEVIVRYPVQQVAAEAVHLLLASEEPVSVSLLTSSVNNLTSKVNSISLFDRIIDIFHCMWIRKSSALWKLSGVRFVRY
jgi:hypothetical protein